MEKAPRRVPFLFSGRVPCPGIVALGASHPGRLFDFHRVGKPDLFQNGRFATLIEPAAVGAAVR